ncbi:hypothetical protein BD779DRAFT_76794 [Infundibulicybe gibba]|nr:hypothetical protein BD779DRAFT_76794 [Infundibulicybe gibba]
MTTFKPTFRPIHMAYCDNCNRGFNTHYALRQHFLDSSRHNYCKDCEIDFQTPNGLKEHWVQSFNHNYCQYCDDHFWNEDDLKIHYENYHHPCSMCHRVSTPSAD